MKFEPSRLASYTEEDLLAEIRRVADFVNQPSLSTKVFDEHSRVGRTTLRRRFGGWREALEAAGLGHLYIERPPARSCRTQARGMTKEQIIDELKRVARKLNLGTLTVDQFKEHAVIGPDTVRSRFGNWPKALQAANLESADHLGRPRYSEQGCFDNLMRVWEHLGRQPMYREMSVAPSTVSGKAYMLRWGTWNKAIHAFVDWINSEDKTESPAMPEEITKSTGPVSTQAMRPDDRQEPSLNASVNRLAQSPSSAKRPEDRRDPSPGLRFKVFSRDRFRCVSCGRSPSHDAGCVLHADHIVPFSKGGKTTFENLRALCERCNLGKGNSLDQEA